MSKYILEGKDAKDFLSELKGKRFSVGVVFAWGEKLYSNVFIVSALTPRAAEENAIAYIKENVFAENSAWELLSINIVEIPDSKPVSLYGKILSWAIFFFGISLLVLVLIIRK